MAVIQPEATMRAILLAVLLLAGCDNPFAPDIPDGAVETAPPAHFENWWRTVELGTGIDGDLSAIRFFRVPSEGWLEGGDSVRGMWIKDGNRIYLASEQWTDDGGVARHEMLHAILVDPTHEHPLFNNILFKSTMAK